QVKATDQLVFHSGQLEHVDMAVPMECGCPPARQPLLRANNDLPVAGPPPTSKAPDTSNPPPSDPANVSPSGTLPGSQSLTSAANELHVQVEAPFVFHATGPPPAPVEDVRALPLDSRAMMQPALAAPLPPAKGRNPSVTETASANPPRRGFFGKLRGFFAAMFR